MSITRLLHSALQLFIPEICCACETNISSGDIPLCPECLKKLESEFCPQALSTEHITRILTFYKYTDIAKKTIVAVKYKKMPRAIKALHLSLPPYLPDMVIPVPLHPKKAKERGYNQSYLLSKSMYPLPINHNLVKIRNTPPQTGRSKTERINNIKNAFHVKDPKDIYDKTILLVDDVTTTGSTLNECAKTLLKAGAKKVEALTVARTV